MGFFVLLLALGVTIILSKNSLTFVSKATTGSEPKNIQISNLTATSFTVSYTTDASALGTLSYGKDITTPSIALDDRDQQTNKPMEHQVHFITVTNLSPATKYYYVIDSGTQKVDNNGSPFEVTTAVSTNQIKGQPPLAGSVSLSDGSTPTEGVVYISLDAFQQLATLINPDGSYSIPLTQLQSTSASSAAALAPETVIQLRAITATQQSVVKLLASQANQVPKIVLSQSYDFTLGLEPTISSAAQIASVSGFPVFTSTAPASSPEITTPKDTQTFKDQQPMFQGKALPNSKVDITIQSQQEISTTVQSDNSGSWQFRPSVSLAPGKHTITIKSVDASGIVQTISKSFTVFAEGSQFTEPSISPVETSPTPTITPSPTTVITPTATPKATPTTTPKPSPRVTIIPSREPLPKTGSTAVVTGMIATISVLGVSALLFFLSVV